MHEQWGAADQDTQYAEYLAYTGLSAGPTMSVASYDQYDRGYPRQLNAAAPDYYPDSLHSFTSYLPYMTFVHGQDETDETITNPYTPALDHTQLAQLAQEEYDGSDSDSEADNDGDPHIMQDVL